ncbi:histone-arginine methyltransferase METTL23 [Culicoides brevitarsis]|uniref:histone-arginine methyltransferase METTL23 n=1 Tax=Culicoides brevitarsis TaxID=469753 RepID=UPI00307B535F
MTDDRDKTTGKEHIKKFSFQSRKNEQEKVEILIPELLQAGYSFYTWPSAHFLASFLYNQRDSLRDKNILELGSGTALPGILCAKLGARVTLSDCSTLPKTQNHIKHSCFLNNLNVGTDINVVGLTWGLLSHNLFQLGALDFIISSDCFYDPTVFEDILVTVTFLLERNPTCKFIFAYQERSADWCLENLLRKWGLKCANINTDRLGENTIVDTHGTGGVVGGSNPSLHLFEITLE